MDETRDLARRLTRVLDVAQTVVRVLLSTQAAPGEEPQPEKVLSETALLLLFASRVDASHRQVHRRIRALAKQLVPHARSDRVLAGITLTPVLAREYAAAHVCLSRLGYPDAKFDEVLARSLSSGAARRRERVPYRQLELEWLGDIWNPSQGGRKRRPSAALAAVTTAGLGLDPLNPTRDDVYAFTHSLLYLTDFGKPRRLPRPKTELVADSEPALAWCLDADDFDVSAEILLAWPLLQARWSPAGAFGFRVLTRVEDEVGYLPSLSLSEERYRELEGAERKRYVVAEAYHTVYVMGLLCAATLQAGALPPEPLSARGAAGAADELVGLLVPREPAPQWERDFAELEPRQRQALAPFLANVALQRAVEASAFERIREVLALCVERGLKPSNAMTQAADLLVRVAQSPYATAQR
ncbi:MAG TPA: hypothetical protein VEG40_12270 [Gaiellaceae bacterium]|nr:hypothetical protein [Gaiellaceae bacterium]